MNTLIKKVLFIFAFAISFIFIANAQDSKSKDTKIEIGGYCPVAYVAANKPVEGDPVYTVTYEGKTYHLANAMAKEMFDVDPQKYIPKYDGYCATALSMGKKLESDPHLFSVYNEAIYLFSNEMAKETFDKNPEMIIKKADENYAAEIK